MSSSDRPAPPTPPDAVRARRAQWAKLASVGQRVGYILIGVSVAAFAVGLVAGFTDTTTVVVGAAIGSATLTLAPAMVLGYAVKAAEREDRAQGR